jgi:allantoicase
MHYARRQRKKGCDWCVVKVVTSLWVNRTCDAHLHRHQYSLTSKFLKVPNIYLIELSSST